jgi:hypothetical protein
MEDQTSQSKGPVLRADLGRVVEVEMTYQDGEVERLKLEIVPDNMADFDAGYLGMGTPLAKSILGKAAGDLIPNSGGDIRSVRLLSVARSARPQPGHIAQAREEKLRKIAEEVDRTNIINFASSFNGKWGDYDPSSLLEDQEKGDQQPPTDSQDQHSHH